MAFEVFVNATPNVRVKDGLTGAAQPPTDPGLEATPLTIDTDGGDVVITARDGGDETNLNIIDTLFQAFAINSGGEVVPNQARINGDESFGVDFDDTGLIGNSVTANVRAVLDGPAGPTGGSTASIQFEFFNDGNLVATEVRGTPEGNQSRSVSADPGVAFDEVRISDGEAANDGSFILDSLEVDTSNEIARTIVVDFDFDDVDVALLNSNGNFIDGDSESLVGTDPTEDVEVNNDDYILRALERDGFGIAEDLDVFNEGPRDTLGIEANDLDQDTNRINGNPDIDDNNELLEFDFTESGIHGTSITLDLARVQDLSGNNMTVLLQFFKDGDFIGDVKHDVPEQNPSPFTEDAPGAFDTVRIGQAEGSFGGGSPDDDGFFGIESFEIDGFLTT